MKEPKEDPEKTSEQPKRNFVDEFIESYLEATSKLADPKKPATPSK